MSSVRRIWDRLTSTGPARPDMRLKIANLTRRSVLAHSAEVADRGATRRKGLLGRDHLPHGEGLWIVPCESVHTIGMQFPIDLVYLNRALEVVKVSNSVPAWRLSACLRAHSVIELPSGTVRATQTTPGDQLEFCAAVPADMAPESRLPRRA